MTNDDKDLKPMTIEEVYKKYNIDNSKKKSIYLWEFQVITQEFVSDMWEAIKHHATRATPQQPIDGNTSDGYHTFNELYDHRCLLWINYCLTNPDKVYLVENHFDGWFLLGKETAWGQISYHCPNKFFNLVEKFDRRHPKFDGHTSNDVINRLVDMAKSQQPSEPLKKLDREEIKQRFQKDYTYDGAFSKDVEFAIDYVVNRFGVPSQPSEPLKELDKHEMVSVLFNVFAIGSLYRKFDNGTKLMIAEEICKHFGQPSEKKALSVEDMKKIMWDLENKLGYQPAYETIAQAIHSALPAQREVRYPDTAYVDKNDGKPGRIEKINYCLGWNHCIDEFKKLNGG